MLRIPVQVNDAAAGVLIVRRCRMTRTIKSVPGRIMVSSPCSSQRAAVATFIRNTYCNIYNARIDVHYPTLMSVNDLTGPIAAVIGLRHARQGPLFLEQYTRRPVEEILECNRGRIVEIGNLASLGGGASLFLFLALASYLHFRGIEFAVATGTKSLEHRLRRIGLQPEFLCAADRDSLTSSTDDWGTYYDTEPAVLAGRVDRSLARLQEAFASEFVDVGLPSRLTVDCMTGAAA